MAFVKNVLQPFDYFTTERRIIMISIAIALAQGLNNVSDLSISYLYKDDYKLNPTQVAAIASFITLPWLLKPCWGMISDNIPLFGYKRKSYISLLGLYGFMCYWLLANWSTSMYSGMFLIFSISIVFAFNNVIGEALLVETAQKFGTSPGRTEAEKQQQASQNVSTFFAVKHMGIVASSYAGGLLLEYMPKSEIFKIASIPPLCVALIALTLPEVKPFIKRFQRPIRMTREEEETSNLIEEISYGQEAHMLSTGVSAMEKIKSFLKKPEIYKPLIFLFLFMITPSAGSAMFFFYTNELKFAPEFMGKLKLASSCAVILGIIIYNKFLRNTPFQKILYWSTIICFFLGLSQILLLQRINVQLGIPDKLFCIGDSIIIQVFGELNFLPILILACRLCPKDVEGTMYALFLAIFNLGGIISVQMGALFTWLLGITEKDFSNMWIMVLISAFFIILPLPWIKKIEFDAAVKKTEEERSLEVGPGSSTTDNGEFDESSLKSF